MDIKALNLIIEFLKNLVFSGSLFAQKIASKTRIFEAIKYMLQSSPLFHSEVIVNIVEVVQELVKVEQQTDSERNACFEIAVISINSKQEFLQR